MASLQAHVAAFQVRRRVKRSLGGRADVMTMRAVFNGARRPEPRGVSYTPYTLGGVPGECVESASGVPATMTLLYLHGGGYIAGSAQMRRPITGWFAAHGIRVFVPNYRLAPEHPYPAALTDVAAVWSALQGVAGVRPGRVAVGGESAGGNLALALMLHLKESGDAVLPDAAAVFSPATDMTVSGASVRTNGVRDSMFVEADLEKLADAYLHGVDPSTPLVSPLYGDLAGLPPLLIHVGKNEVLLDDSVRFAERARAVGVPVELRIWPVVPHGWQLAQAAIPEARRSLAIATTFLRCASRSGRDAATGTSAVH